MSFQITDTGASIRFISDDSFFFLMKHHITAIKSIPDNIVRIDVGCCMHSIFLQAVNVTEPVNSGSVDLAEILHNWTKTFVEHCCNPDLDPMR